MAKNATTIIKLSLTAIAHKATLFARQQACKQRKSRNKVSVGEDQGQAQTYKQRK